MAPTVSLLAKRGIIEAVAYGQTAVFEAAVMFARTEGIIPAPETAHAIRAAIDEAVRCREQHREEVILFNFSGHGHFDLTAYDQYYERKLEDYEHPASELERTIKDIEQLNRGIVF